MATSLSLEIITSDVFTLLNSLKAVVFIIMYGYRRGFKDTYQKLPNCTGE